MRSLADTRFFASAARGRVELVLRQEDGSDWTLTVSPGIEQFIGHYPRICGIAAPGGPLLAYRVADCG